MKRLDIFELCQLQAMLICYLHELQDIDMLDVDEDDFERNVDIGIISSALNIVIDDIKFRSEQ